MATKDKDNIEQVEQTQVAELPDPEELVTFTAPMIATGDPHDIYMSVNGENIMIKPGETVKIKRKFVLAYEDGMRQHIEAVRYQQGLAKNSNKPAAEL